MKYLCLNQIIHEDDKGDGSDLVSQIYVNRDMIKWFHYTPLKKGRLSKVRLAMVGSDETIDVMETPDQIEQMSRDIVNIRVMKEVPFIPIGGDEE